MENCEYFEKKNRVIPKKSYDILEQKIPFTGPVNVFQSLRVKFLPIENLKSLFLK